MLEVPAGGEEHGEAVFVGSGVAVCVGAAVLVGSGVAVCVAVMGGAGCICVAGYDISLADRSGSFAAVAASLKLWPHNVK